MKKKLLLLSAIGLLLVQIGISQDPTEFNNGVLINPSTANKNYLQFKNNGTPIGIIGSDGSISAGTETNLGIYVYGNNQMDFWTNSNKRLSITGDGKVGIGTNIPLANLHVFSGTTHPTLLISNNSVNAYDPQVSLLNDGNNGAYFRYDAGQGDAIIANTRQGMLADLHLRTKDINRLTITGDGKVGIGTDAPDYPLDVAGTIRAHEVIVEVTAPAPDYVFEEDYNLRTLSEVENFVKENKHLPDVPAGESMEENGIGVAEMNMLLLKKMEEMTLYMIEQNKKLETVMKAYEAQQKEIEKIEEELDK